MTKRQDILGGLNDSVNVIPDNMNRVSVWENTAAGDLPFARSRYTYDNLSRERVVSRDEEPGKGDTFAFNDRNQLIGASYNVAVPTPTPNPTPTPAPTATPTPPPPGQVAAPVFNPPNQLQGTHPAQPLTVTLHTVTAGAQMYYTTNGGDPHTDPNRTLIASNNGSVVIPGGTGKTLQAFAFKSGMIDSAVTSGDYDCTDPTVGPVKESGATTAVSAPAPRTVSYAFTNLDPLNRDSVTENGVLTNYTANKLNQYANVGGQSISYDGNFNLTAYQGQSYAYDAQNEMVTSMGGATVQCVYDGLGRVLKRTINGRTTIFVYDAWKAFEELDGSGNLTAWNVYGAGPDEILYRNQNGTALIYHTDKEGNVTWLLDGTGNGIEKYRYDAFGNATITDLSGMVRSVSAYGNRYMFNGKDYVAEMGIYDYRHRWYQPQLGRFLQVDPKGFDAGDENLFRYCMDDPVDRTDPDGLIGMGYQAEQAAEQERRYEITSREIRQEVTGSHIPQVVGREVTITVNRGATDKNSSPAAKPAGSNGNLASAIKQADGVAKGVLQKVNPISIRQNLEKIFLVYKDAQSRQVVSTGVQTTTETGLEATFFIPTGSQVFGVGHTHGDYSRRDPQTGAIVRTTKALDGFHSDTFSDTDKFNLRNYSHQYPTLMRGYLGTPSSALLKYDIQSGVTSPLD